MEQTKRGTAIYGHAEKVNTYSISDNTTLTFLTGDIAVMRFLKNYSNL